MRVLIVDDSDLVRERLAVRVAEIVGIRVEQATNGATALSAIYAEVPDIVVLDIEMPGLGGFGVLSALRSAERAPTVMVLTNHPEYRAYALQQGAAYFYDKSTQIEAMCAQLLAMAAEPKVRP